jgi:hypothetical protein
LAHTFGRNPLTCSGFDVGRRSLPDFPASFHIDLQGVDKNT